MQLITYISMLKLIYANLNNDLCRDFSPVYLLSFANFCCSTQIVAARKNTKKSCAASCAKFQKGFLELRNRVFDVFPIFSKINRKQNKAQCKKYVKARVVYNRVLLTYREWQLNNCYNKHYLLHAAHKRKPSWKQLFTIFRDFSSQTMPL